MRQEDFSRRRGINLVEFFDRVSGHSDLCISRMELEIILGSRHFSPHHPRYVENQREKGRNGKPTSPCSAGVQGTPAGELSVR